MICYRVEVCVLRQFTLKAMNFQWSPFSASLLGA